MEKRKTVVLIASAEERVRKQWTQFLKEDFSISEVTTREALEQALKKTKPTVLLLDYALPKLGAVESLSSLLSLSPKTNIILLTNPLDKEEAIRALKIGLTGYCSKDMEPSLLAKAVHVVQQGNIWVGRNVISHLLEELTSVVEQRGKESPQKQAVDLNCLTLREREITKLIGHGLCNKEIAAQLKITERTVKAHLTVIFRKLQVGDRLRLALLVTDRNQVK